MILTIKVNLKYLYKDFFFILKNVCVVTMHFSFYCTLIFISNHTFKKYVDTMCIFNFSVI